MNISKRFSWLLLFLVGFAGRAANDRVAKDRVANEKPPAELDALIKLSQEFRRFPPDYFAQVSPDPRKQAPLDVALLGRVSPKVLKARQTYYLPTYVGFAKREKLLDRQIKSLRARMVNTPLSDFKNRSELELKLAAAQADYDKTRLGLFLWSIEASAALQEAARTVPAEKRVASAPTPPKMPGVFGGSSDERKKLKDWEKPNLTPVDPAFYQTQLGRKLERDMAGRADFWSYDFNSDELYVKVGDSLSKVRVKDEGGGVRFIQTRVGADFKEPRGADARVDMPNAQGRFLTGNKDVETLFGAYPKDRPAFTEEGKHSPGDAHDH